ncbi:hypothetical protein [Nostoc sp. UIC 10607]|uniref:hypothetical protein n=1 Tax=Nostoc sp. UIC 10607 TaxID=3045935 RepID=UPI00399EFE40
MPIKNDFRRYIRLGKISEGLVKFLTFAPLMRLGGFYDVPIRLTMEDSIAIAVEDEDRIITGWIALESDLHRDQIEDFFVVLGTQKKDRKSSVVWQENGKYPSLIVEILSSSATAVDNRFKKSLSAYLPYTRLFLVRPWNNETSGISWS